MSEKKFIHDAVHDISLMLLLAGHHECLILGNFNGIGSPELSQAARTATKALEHLNTLLQHFAASEYPTENITAINTDNYSGHWPPRITNEGEA